MSKTLETDAEIGYFDLETAVSADFARRLERERDEAREQVENQKARIGEFFAALEKLTSERDEARKKYDTLAVENMLEVNKLCKERDEWAAMCGRYKQERDELLNEIKRLRIDAQREAENHDRMVKELEGLYDKLKS